MADFAVRNLSVLAYAQGFTHWHYKHRGPLSEVLSFGFFNPVADMMAGGDHISISAENGGAVAFVHRSKDGKGVDFEAMTSTVMPVVSA